MQHRSTCLHALIRSTPTLALLMLSQDTTLLVPAGVREDDSTILDALYQSLTTVPLVPPSALSPRLLLIGCPLLPSVVHAQM